MKNENQMLKELETRKINLVDKLKKLKKQELNTDTNREELAMKKQEIERELVEIMDRLTQINYLLKK